MDDKLKKATDDFVFTIRLGLREVDRLEAEGQGVRADAILKALYALTGETLSDLDKILENNSDDAGGFDDKPGPVMKGRRMMTGEL